jgi:hypothetical protein
MIEQQLKMSRKALEKILKQNVNLNDVNELIEISNQVFKKQ